MCVCVCICVGVCVCVCANCMSVLLYSETLSVYKCVSVFACANVYVYTRACAFGFGSHALFVIHG